ncbi:hypothetical protein D3C80_1186040 [compost metagenome]
MKVLTDDPPSRVGGTPADVWGWNDDETAARCTVMIGDVTVQQVAALIASPKTWDGLN